MDAAAPWKILVTTIASMLCANAWGMMRIAQTNAEAMKISLRPISSENGARKRGVNATAPR